MKDLRETIGALRGILRPGAGKLPLSVEALKRAIEDIEDGGNERFTDKYGDFASASLCMEVVPIVTGRGGEEFAFLKTVDGEFVSTARAVVATGAVYAAMLYRHWPSPDALLRRHRDTCLEYSACIAEFYPEFEGDAELKSTSTNIEKVWASYAKGWCIDVLSTFGTQLAACVFTRGQPDDYMATRNRIAEDPQHKGTEPFMESAFLIMMTLFMSGFACFAACSQSDDKEEYKSDCPPATELQWVELMELVQHRVATDADELYALEILGCMHGVDIHGDWRCYTKEQLATIASTIRDDHRA